MGWVVSTTPRPLYPQERPGTHCIGDGVGSRAGLDGCGKSLPTEIRSPDRPARSESLYRLGYRGPEGKKVKTKLYPFSNLQGMKIVEVSVKHSFRLYS